MLEGRRSFVFVVVVVVVVVVVFFRGFLRPPQCARRASASALAALRWTPDAAALTPRQRVSTEFYRVSVKRAPIDRHPP